jgi:hypothetical protein
MTSLQVDFPRVAHLLAARMAHDFAGPISGLSAGLDLLTSPNLDEFREDSLGLIQASVQRLVSLLDFQRAAHGGDDTPMDPSRLQQLAKAFLAEARINLDWRVGSEPLSGVQSRILLGLIQLVEQMAARGGSISVECWRRPFRLRIVRRATKIRVPDEVVAGLLGEAPADGNGARWSHAFLILADLKANDGSVTTRTEADQFTIDTTFG